MGPGGTGVGGTWALDSAGGCTDAGGAAASGGGAGVRGARAIDGASASEAPQKRQKCDDGSEPPRHLGQRRSMASAAGVPRSTTRAGAMGAGAGAASNAGGRMVLIGGSLPGAFAGGALLPFREKGEAVAA
jgi:hypothetical protein